MEISRIRPRWQHYALIASAISTVSCTDSATDPMSSIVAPETQAALELGRALPRLSEVWVEAGGAPGTGPIAGWEDSWALPTAEGRAERAAIYRAVVPVLLPRMEDSRVRELLNGIDATLARVDQFDVLPYPDRLRTRVDAVRRSLARSRGSLEEGGLETALGAAFEAADYLLELSPEHVASQLLAAAESGARRIPGADAYPEETLGRVEQLMDLARKAILRGDYGKAIRGAYYACLLLGVEIPE